MLDRLVRSIRRPKSDEASEPKIKHVVFVTYMQARQSQLALLNSRLIVPSEDIDHPPAVLLGEQRVELKRFDVSSDCIIEGVERRFWFCEIPIKALRELGPNTYRPCLANGSIQQLASDSRLSIKETRLLQKARDGARHLIPSRPMG